MFSITPSARLRPSPFYQSTLKEGVQEFTTYNNMLMPTGYGDPEGEYWRLIRGVSQWDVAVERQVQLEGPDAGRLAQILAPRDLSKCKTGQGKYVAICNHDGILINDPILLKVNEQCYWLSIADSNIWFWAKAIASERKLRVEVSEPDVSPMAIQGPKSDDVVASVCGDWVRELKYFWFRETSIEGIPVAVARSGWSKQRGFEIYLMDGSQGDRLWDIFREAGKPWDIGPGNPNLMERIESGLLSWGGDTDEETNPFEVRMGKYVDLDVPGVRTRRHRSTRDLNRSPCRCMIVRTAGVHRCRRPRRHHLDHLDPFLQMTRSAFGQPALSSAACAASRRALLCLRGRRSSTLANPMKSVMVATIAATWNRPKFPVRS